MPCGRVYQPLLLQLLEQIVHLLLCYELKLSADTREQLLFKVFDFKHKVAFLSHF